MVFLTSLLLNTALAQSNWPAGSTIDQAMAAQITEEGLSSVGSLASVLIPAELPVPDQYEGISGFNFSLEDAVVNIEIVDTVITPGHGVINADISLLISINDANNNFDLEFQTFWAPTYCNGYIEAFPASVTLPIALQIVTQSDGTRVLDAIVGDLELQQGLASEHIHLGCIFDVLDDFLRDYLGFSYFDWIIGLVEGELTGAIGDIAPDLEAAIEDAFSAAQISEDIDILGNMLHIEAYPDDVNISPDGVELVLAGSSSAPVSNCISAGSDPGGSLKTATDLPALGNATGGVAILVADDFANQVLYTMWRGGVLCFDLADAGDLPLNTSILGLLAGDAFNEFFPEPSPLLISTSPQSPPIIYWEGEHDINVVIEGLGLDIFATVNQRISRLIGLQLDVDLGADLEFDGNTGAMNIVVDFDPNAIDVSIAFNELAPDANDAIIEQFSGVFSSLIDPIIGSALGDLAFTLGSMEGVGLTSLESRAAGPYGDGLEASAGLGPVSYGSGDGCGGEDGCGGGCGGDSAGCSSARVKSRTLLALFPLLLVAFRRSRHG
ncbi:MAG: hypothetical protein VX519_12540 [Myxococcota bacterium]|nr:hypothetical protein [Myxococcota bacterium]